jgi:D-alanyl-D-alanine carboxypeptidase
VRAHGGVYGGFGTDARFIAGSRIDELVAKAMAELPIRGVSILATRAGTTIFDRGYGFADGEIKVGTMSSTPYPVGSLTKSFTAAILALRDSGKIDLDAPIGRYVPEAGSGSRLTVLTLLQQRSGITNFLGDFAWEQKMRNATAAETLATLASTPLRFALGAGV